MGLEQYYIDLKAKRTELTAQFPTGFCYVISLDSHQKNVTGGSIAEVSVDNAARNIVEGTHRLTTAAEVETYLEVQTANRKRDALGALAVSRLQFQQDLIKRTSR